MADPRHAVNRRQDVLRVDGARAADIQPRGEDGQAAKITAVFVGHGVVGVVAPRAPDLVRAQQCFAALRQPRGHGAIYLARVLWADPLRNASMSSATSSAGRPALETACPFCVRDELRAVESNEVVLGDVVAERVEEPRRHHLAPVASPS